MFRRTPCSEPPASLPEMLWLAMIFLLWAYVTHFKTDFDEVKNKVGLLNWFNQSTYLAGHQLVSKKCCG